MYILSIVLNEPPNRETGTNNLLFGTAFTTVFGLVDSENRESCIVNAFSGFCEDVYAVRMLGERHKLA